MKIARPKGDLNVPDTINKILSPLVMDTPKGMIPNTYHIDEIVGAFDILAGAFSCNGIELNLCDDHYKNIDGEKVYNIKFVVKGKLSGGEQYTLSSWIISFFDKMLNYKIKGEDEISFQNCWEILNHRFSDKFFDLSVTKGGKTTNYKEGVFGFDKICKRAGKIRDAIFLDIEKKAPTLTDFIRFVRVHDYVLHSKILDKNDIDYVELMKLYKTFQKGNF